MIRINKNQITPMNLDEITQKAPSIFTTQPHSTLSDKYVHIPTKNLIDDMSSLGWQVTNVDQVNLRKDKKNRDGYQKHLVIFMNEELVIEDHEDGPSYVQILMTNSHDGTNSFKFDAGLFRLVCSNGLVVSDTEFNSFKIKHIGYSFDNLRKNINTFVSDLPKIIDGVYKLKNVKLTETDKFNFVLDAFKLRLNREKLDNVIVNMNEFLKPVRSQDSGDDMWKVYNLTQEKLTNGGFTYYDNNKMKKLRSLRSFNSDIKFNKKLFNAAMEYC